MYEWAVVGAGPAGILAVGKLIDAGVLPQSIAWIDPFFKVGDLGQYWRNVSSNTKVYLFLKFLNGCAAFNYSAAPKNFSLDYLDLHDTCDLHYIVEPLQWVSDHLSQSVSVFKDKVDYLQLQHRVWNIRLSSSTIISKNVILAMGAEPKTFLFPKPQVISLCDALDNQRLSAVCEKNDTVAVFGSSHSAILVLKNLVEYNVKRIINFYLEPLRFAVELEDGILFDDSGLKGKTAQWARECLHGEGPKNLERIISSEEHLKKYLLECNKVVYAVGFERRHLPVVAGLKSLQYNAETGIIAPGLFGLGIAFPEYRQNSWGIREFAVGLWKFMMYIDRVLPIWMKYTT